MNERINSSKYAYVIRCELDYKPQLPIPFGAFALNFGEKLQEVKMFSENM